MHTRVENDGYYVSANKVSCCERYRIGWMLFRVDL